MKKNVSPTLKWQQKVKQGAKANGLADVKTICHHCTWTSKGSTRKKHNPEPGKGKPDSLISSVRSGQPNADSDISQWRRHLEASYGCVSHIGKKMIKETVSFLVILLKLGDVCKCKATWTPRNECATWKATSVPPNSKKREAKGCSSTVRIQKCFTRANK